MLLRVGRKEELHSAGMLADKAGLSGKKGRRVDFSHWLTEGEVGQKTYLPNVVIGYWPMQNTL